MKTGSTTVAVGVHPRRNHVSDTVSKGRELLLMQGLPQSICALATEEEAKRFLLANNMDVDRAAEGLARRAKFLASRATRRIPLSSLVDVPKLKELLPMYWSRSPTSSAVLFVSFSKAFDSAQFVEACHSDANGKHFFEWIGEAVAEKCNTTQDRLSVVLDLSDAPFGQTTTPAFDQLVRSGASYLQSMHPERLKHVFVLNAPPTFHMMMYTLKRVCSGQILSKFTKIDSVSGIPSSVISQECIPRTLGGKQRSLWSDEDSAYVEPPRRKGKETAPTQVATGAPVTVDASAAGTTKQEVEQLLDLLRLSSQKANECEKRHLDENSRLRRKLALVQRNVEKPLDPEEAELRAQVQAAMDERDAYRRAVAFARNFIDQEMEERKEFVSDIAQEIEQKRRENLALVEALKSAFGSDAPNLFL